LQRHDGGQLREEGLCASFGKEKEAAHNEAVSAALDVRHTTFPANHTQPWNRIDGFCVEIRCKSKGPAMQQQETVACREMNYFWIVVERDPAVAGND